MQNGTRDGHSLTVTVRQLASAITDPFGQAKLTFDCVNPRFCLAELAKSGEESKVFVNGEFGVEHR